MSQDTVWCDNAFFQLTANMLKRDIVFYTLYKEDGHDSKGRIFIKAKESLGKMFLLYYTGIHFQSIVPKLGSITNITQELAEMDISSNPPENIQ